MKSKIKILSILAILLLLVTPINANADTNTTENNKVILGGDPFGIKMFSDGVMVIKTQKVKSQQGELCPAEKAGIMQNDVIITAQGEYLKSNEQLQSIIEESNGCSVKLKIMRGEKYLTVDLIPVKDTDGIYKAGMWIRDSAAGIGTITFYSEELGGFCGLGHGICDVQTGALVPIASGDVDKAFISSVTKSEDGNVGSLNGYFENEDIGSATSNRDEGIYGKLDTTECEGKEIEIAEAEEIETGKAYIYTTVNGSEPKSYDAEIVKINKDSEKANLIIKITDTELLSATGGIVQGMSGSPIVQNNKLVGAITHVIVDDVDCGYGIFAESMFEILVTNCK